MTLFGWSITKEIVACFSLVMGLYCSILAPYPFCYKYESRVEGATEVRINFVRNEFFRDCSMEKKIKIDTDKDVVVVLDGKEYKRISKDERICQK